MSNINLLINILDKKYNNLFISYFNKIDTFY